MKGDKSERFPAYVPAYYKIFIKMRKIYRQTMVRISESKAKKEGVAGVTTDGIFSGTVYNGTVPENPLYAVNKSAVWLDDDMRIPEIVEIVKKFDVLKNDLSTRGLKYTNTAGTFLPRMFYPRSEKTKLWENVWTIHHSGVKHNHKVLDIGGASTAFCFYLANMGCSVEVVDNDWGNCGTLYNTRYVGRKMGWTLKAYGRDVAEPLPFIDNSFDRVFSICTVEHLTSGIRQKMMKEVGRVLRPGGIAGITMCYCNDLKEVLVDKGLRFGYREKLETDIIKPSGLEIYGNTDLVDIFPNENFLGALFLTKK